MKEDVLTRLLREEQDRLILEARRTSRAFKSPWLTSTELAAQKTQPVALKEQTDE